MDLRAFRVESCASTQRLQLLWKCSHGPAPLPLGMATAGAVSITASCDRAMSLTDRSAARSSI